MMTCDKNPYLNTDVNRQVALYSMQTKDGEMQPSLSLSLAFHHTTLLFLSPFTNAFIIHLLHLSLNHLHTLSTIFTPTHPASPVIHSLEVEEHLIRVFEERLPDIREVCHGGPINDSVIGRPANLHDVGADHIACCIEPWQHL